MRCPYRLVTKTGEKIGDCVKMVVQEFPDCYEDDCPFWTEIGQSGECLRAINEGAE